MHSTRRSWGHILYVSDMNHPPIFDERRDGADNVIVNRNPEITPGLFEGDIVLPFGYEVQNRISLRDPIRLWTDRVVPYYISTQYTDAERAFIIDAIKTLNSMSCVQFVPGSGREKNYVLIASIDGCASLPGRVGGEQIVSLEPSLCLRAKGTTMHELMHTLGFFHEQARWDRDDYVEIHYENIKDGMDKQFKIPPKDHTTQKFAYDYNSVMHYPNDAFTKYPGKPTITAKDSPGRKLGQRKTLSILDCMELNDLYGCREDPNMRKKYDTLCYTFGYENSIRYPPML